MSTAQKQPLTLATMIETLLMDGYVMQFEPQNRVFIVAKPSEEEIHFDGNFLECIREPFFGPKELRDSNDPRIKGLSQEVTGVSTGVTVTGKTMEKTCSHCGHTSRKYKITFSALHVRLAKILFEYCVKNKTHEITKKDIAGVMTHTDYGNFYILQRFGLMYFIKDEDGKKKRGSWGVPLKRLHKFLKNETTVAEYFWRDKDESTNSLSEKRIYLRDVPKNESIIDYSTMLPTFLSFENDPYFSQYTE